MKWLIPKNLENPANLLVKFFSYLWIFSSTILSLNKTYFNFAKQLVR